MARHSFKSTKMQRIRWKEHQRIQVINQAAKLIVEKNLGLADAAREAQKVLGAAFCRHIESISGENWEWYRAGVRQKVDELLVQKMPAPKPKPKSPKASEPVPDKRPVGRPRKVPGPVPDKRPVGRPRKVHEDKVPKVQIPLVPVPLSFEVPPQSLSPAWAPHDSVLVGLDFADAPGILRVATPLSQFPMVPEPTSDLLPVIAALAEALQEQVAQSRADRVALFEMLKQDRSELAALMEKHLQDHAVAAQQKGDKQAMALLKQYGPVFATLTHIAMSAQPQGQPGAQGQMMPMPPGADQAGAAGGGQQQDTPSDTENAKANEEKADAAILEALTDAVKAGVPMGPDQFNPVLMKLGIPPIDKKKFESNEEKKIKAMKTRATSATAQK